MANEIKYLSYDGLDYFWNQKLKPIIEENEEDVATALADFDNRLITHIHTKYAPTSHTHTYVASAGYSASAAKATYSASAFYAACAGRVNKPLIILGNGTSLGRYNGSTEFEVNITPDIIGASPSSHTHTYVASAGYSASAAKATYSASAGYSASAAKATYSASAGYVSRVNLLSYNLNSYYPMVFTTARTATVGALLYIDSDVTNTSSTATGIRYNPYYNRCYCSGGFYEASDERLKNFGDDIEVDLDKLSKLSKKYFTWKDDESNTQHIGVSAQEVQAIYPELVEAIDNEGHLSVSYDKLSVVAIKGIDVLNDKITSLEKRLDKLEGKLNIAQ